MKNPMEKQWRTELRELKKQKRDLHRGLKRVRAKNNGVIRLAERDTLREHRLCDKHFRRIQKRMQYLEGRLS